MSDLTKDEHHGHDVRVDGVVDEGDGLLEDVQDRDNQNGEDGVGQGVPSSEDEVREDVVGDGRNRVQNIKRAIRVLRLMGKNQTES
jgi:hypothetical protein